MCTKKDKEFVLHHSKGNRMKFDLSSILGNSSDQIIDHEPLEMDTSDAPEKHAPAGYCIECGGKIFFLIC